MNLSSKTRYALKIMIDLGSRGEEYRADRSEMIENHGIPAHYLDQILLRLKRGGLIQSFRGRRGGYLLAKSPEHISAYEIVSVVEDTVAPVLCVVSPSLCEHHGNCISEPAWHTIFMTIRSSLESLTLVDLISAESHKLQFFQQTPSLVTESLPTSECRAGRRKKEQSERLQHRSTLSNASQTQIGSRAGGGVHD